MKLTARLYKINKGKHNQYAYFATFKKEDGNRAGLKERDAVLLKFNDVLFATLIKKLNTGNYKFMLGFTVPFRIGSHLHSKSNLTFDFVGKSLHRLISNTSKSLDLMSIIPERSVRGFPIYLFDNSRQIIAWIYSKGNKMAALPKTIPLSEGKYDILELVGAFFCEGFKSRKETRHRDRFSFSNADVEQVKWFAEAAERLLGIKKSKWSVQILYPKDDIKSIEEMKSYWSSFGLLKDKINLVKNTTTNNLNGVCILNIFNSSLAESFYYIAEECQKLALLSKNNAIRFFRGLSRGDLGVGEHNRTVSFTTESYENAIFFRNLCKLIGIDTSNPRKDPRGNYWDVNIYGRQNFEKLLALGCITHRLRRERLYNQILRYKRKPPVLIP